VTKDSASPAADEPAEMHDLGVLFVHGIGEQQQGSTLVGFGEPIYRWLDRWFDGLVGSWKHAGLQQAQELEWFKRHSASWLRHDDPRALGDAFDTRLRLAGHMNVDASVETVDLPALEELQNDVAGGLLAARVSLRDAQARQASTGTPSHALMELHALGSDGTAHRARWLLAESWWAQTFFEPSRAELATWLIMVVPWSLGSHFGVRVRRARRRARIAASAVARVRALSSMAGQLAWLVVSLPLAVLIELLVGLVVLIGLIPVPAMRRVLVAAERVLARTLGDSFVLISSPLQQAAIVAQVQRDVAWLSSRCRTVAVIAHSQGGAVAHRALRLHRPANVRLLLTFGSGLRKLEEMEHIARVDDGLHGRVYLTVAAVALVGYAVWALATGAAGAPWTGATGGGLFVFLVLSYLSRAHALDGAWFMALLREPGLWWADYHATADPVSNGPLEDHDFRTGGPLEEPASAPASEGPVSVSICNERSFTRDHTTYWQNTEEFVGPVVMWLTWLTPGPWHGAVARSPAQRAPAVSRRHCRVWALVFSRSVAALAVTTVLAARWRTWLEVGRWGSTKASAALGGLMPGDIASRFAMHGMDPPPLDAWASTLGPVVAIALLGRVCRALWERWTELDQRTYFRPRPTIVDAQGASRLDEGRATLDIFTASWWFFSATALHGVIVALAAPGVIAAGRPGVWTSLSTVSVCGFVAALVYAAGSWRAVARARTVPGVTG
jgi:hypothetical protein